MVKPIFLLLLGLVVLCLSGFSSAIFCDAAQAQALDNSTDEFADRRLQMVEQQVQARGIQDRAVLEAILKVPRHRFVDPSVAHLAYEDRPLAIGYRQTISQPYIVAYMSEVAEISPNETVLEIGTGSGYQAAVLGELAKDVYTVEIVPELAEKARQTLNKLGYQNVHAKRGDAYHGWEEHAPYDAIIVTAAPDRIPEPLVEQLALNGKMVIPVGSQEQEMVVLTKTEDGVLTKKTIPVRFVPLTRELPKA